MDKVFDFCIYCHSVTEQYYVNQCCETLIKCKNCEKIVDILFNDEYMEVENESA